MKSFSTLAAPFSHFVNQFTCTCLSLSHDNSEILSTLKFKCRTTNSANVVTGLSAKSLTTQTFQKALVPSQENYLRAPHSIHIRVYYNSVKVKSYLIVFASLCGNEIIFSSITDFFPASLDSDKSDDISCKHQPILCIDLDFIIIMLLYKQQFSHYFVF